MHPSLSEFTSQTDCPSESGRYHSLLPPHTPGVCPISLLHFLPSPPPLSPTFMLEWFPPPPLLSPTFMLEWCHSKGIHNRPAIKSLCTWVHICIFLQFRREFLTILYNVGLVCIIICKSWTRSSMQMRNRNPLLKIPLFYFLF